MSCLKQLLLIYFARWFIFSFFLKTVVQRVSNSSAKNLDCGDGTNACASTPDDLGDATSGETAVLAMTRWARNSYAGKKE